MRLISLRPCRPDALCRGGTNFPRMTSMRRATPSCSISADHYVFMPGCSPISTCALPRDIS